MASGTVYPAKVNLKALLEAWTWPGGAPKVMWGEPIKADEIVYESIYFGGTEVTDSFRTLGATRSDETYNLLVVIDVRAHGDEEQAMEQRVWQLHDEVITLLRENMDLGGAIKYLTGYRVRQANPVPATEQLRSMVLIEVGCVGHITY